MHRYSRHFSHYFPLIGLFVLAAYGFWLFSYDRSFQLAVAGATAAAYVIWGIIHHVIHKDLYLAVIIEYLAVATLGLVIVFSLILNT